jgi:hypothetical protein
MKSPYRTLVVLASASFFYASAQAQNAGTVTNHAFAVGKGPGTTGYTSLLCGSAQLAVGQAAADPICRTITGDVTISAAGVTAIGTAKVTSAMLRDSGAISVIGRSANSTGVPADISATVDGHVLRRSASTLGFGTIDLSFVNTVGSSILGAANGGTGLSSLGTGIATFLGTPSSANLRAALTDEVGTGAAYFVGGALGTPASATLTNATGLPANGGLTGQVPKANGGLGATTLSSAIDTEFSSTQGSILYRNASAWVALPPGTSGQLLSTGGPAANPSWATAGGTGTVTSVTCGTGLSGGTITTTGTCATALTNVSNSLGADVAMNNTANYFDGPSVAQGTSGTWLATGTVTVTDSSASAAFYCKLWDGTTVISSASGYSGSGTQRVAIALSGVIASPAANIKISCRDATTTNGAINFNLTGNSKDSTLTAVRIQ